MIAPEQAQQTRHHAIQCHLAGRFDEALGYYSLLLVLDPSDAHLWDLVGALRYQTTRTDLAFPLSRRAVLIAPHVASYHSNFALSLLEAGEAQSGLRQTSLALILDPAIGDSLINHGAALREVARYEEAVQFGYRSLLLKAGLSAAYSSLGHSLYFLDRNTEAIRLLRAALILAPNNPKVLHVLGLTMATIGQSAALTFVRGAWQIWPRLDFLASVVEIARADDRISLVEELRGFEEAWDTLIPRQQVLLCFSLAKVYEDLGDKEQWFRYLMKGNAQQRGRVSYDEATTLGLFDRTIEVFTKEFLSHWSGASENSDLPIFIVGLPRSGTSLIEQVLASHPSIHGAGEIRDFPQLLDELDTDGLIFPDNLDVTSPEKIADIGRRYVLGLRRRHPTAERITDKLPGNVPFVGLIHMAMPNARIIQIRRDPVDACLSCYSKLFVGNLSYTYDLAELGRVAGRYQRLMDRWEEVIPPARLMSLHYEEFVADQENQTRRLLEFCGLPWHEGCLDFHKSNRAVRTASIQQVRRPLYKSSVGRWRPAPELLAPLLRGLEGN